MRGAGRSLTYIARVSLRFAHVARLAYGDRTSISTLSYIVSLRFFLQTTTQAQAFCSPVARQPDPRLQHGQLPAGAKQAVRGTLGCRLRLPGWLFARREMDKQRRRRRQRRVLGMEDGPHQVSPPSALEGGHRARMAAARDGE